MRQALIVGARPAFTRGRAFPRVPLEKGSWEIRGENIEGSRISLTIYTPTQANGGICWFPKVVELPTPPEFYLVVGPVEISTEITHSGRETHISLFAYARAS